MASRQEGDGKGFLSRWSQRKRAVEEEGAEPEAPQPAESSDPAATEDAEAIDPKDLPDIDSLDAGSDYSVFLKKGVPPGLKRKALNKLWQTDPAFRHICMLDDYNLDYTDAAMVVPNLKTLFQVGRGMVLPEEEEEAAAKEAAERALEGPGAEELPQAVESSSDDAVAEAEADEGANAASVQVSKKRPHALMPGTPRVPAEATRGDSDAGSRRASAPRQGERSARQRRWGDPGET